MRVSSLKKAVSSQLWLVAVPNPANPVPGAITFGLLIAADEASLKTGWEERLEKFSSEEVINKQITF